MAVARYRVVPETEPYPVSPPELPALPEGGLDQFRLARLHESIAAMLASRGQWRQAYQYLRSALALSIDTVEPPPVPEQLRREVDQLRREHAEAREQSLRDSLTASYNRRYLDERLGDLSGEPRGLAVALVDLDWFKQVNDTHGHLLGDRVLQRVVEVLCDVLPADSFCARYGGEEFVLVLPDVNGSVAVAICEAARARVEHHPWSELAPGLRVTVSIGVIQQARAAMDDEHAARLRSVDTLLGKADELLYAAKQSGRNAVAYRTAGTGAVALAGAAAGRRAAPHG